MPISTTIATPKVIELQPNRQYIDPEFDGYKLSLDVIPIIKKELDKPVDRILLSSTQYTFLHVKLAGLYNHLLSETIEETDFVYVVDKSWTIKKITLDDDAEDKIIIEDVIVIQRNEQVVESQHYNVSLKFISKSLAIFSDGNGKLYILQTGIDRRYSKAWTCLYSTVILSNDKGFVTQDAKFHISNNGNEIHCLLYSIEEEESVEKHFFNILYWVIMKEVGEKCWEKSSVKEITGKGMLYYAYLENSCEFLYIVSDGNYQFIKHSSDSPVIGERHNLTNNKKYCWSQSEDEIMIQLKMPDNIDMELLHVNTAPGEIFVKINGQVILNGKLSHRIDEYLTTWSIENGLLEVKINKADSGHTWTHLIPGDNSGEYLVDVTAAEEIHNKLANFCSENESRAGFGATFNSEQVEECDFEQDKYTTFERLSKSTGETTHKVNINTHTLLFTLQKEPYSPPALVLRHDVDAYVWQPIFENDSFTFVHEGTLNAFGYVQASKQQRKFSVCAPDMSYCAVCETSRHLFIYRQRKTVNSGELRNRSSGRRVRHIAQQQVVNLPDEEILGIYAATSKLFLLTSESVYVLFML